MPTGPYDPNTPPASVRRVEVAFWGFLCVSTLLRLVFIALAMPSGDELYMWQGSRNLDWCTVDAPFFLKFQIFLTTTLLGHSTLGIRLASPFYAALIGFGLYRWGREAWNDVRVGATAGILFLIIPVGSLAAVYAATDVPLTVWWFLASYALWRAVNTGRRRWWLGVGVFLLLGCVSKFPMVFWIPGAFIYLLWDRNARPWLRRPDPYLALAIGALSAIPFILWNVRNEWIGLLFQVHGRHDFHPTLKYIGELFGAQVALASPVLFVCAVLAVAWAWRGRAQDAGTLKLLLCSSLITLAILTLMGLGVRVSPLWPGVGYPTAMLLIAAWMWEQRPDGAPARKRVKAVKIGAAVSLVLVVPLHFFVFAPDLILVDALKHLGRPTKISKRQLKDFYGWKELAGQVSVRMAEMNAQHPTFIITPSSTISGFLAFYTDQRHKTLLYREETGDGRTYGETSENVMGAIYWQDLPSKLGHDLLFVTDRKDNETVKRFSRYSTDWELLDEVPVVHKGIELRRFYIYRGRDFQGVPAG